MVLDDRNDEKFIVREGILTKYIGNDQDVSIPEGIIEIDTAAFMGRSEIISIQIPDSVERIGKYAFASCSSLKKVYLGFGVRNIPMGCFMELPKLENVILSDRIVSIGDLAFKGCKSLRSIEFLSLKQRDPITLEEKAKAYDAMIHGKPRKICYVDVSDSIPAIGRIGNYAFAGCTQFDETAIKEKTIHLGTNAFDGNIEDNLSSKDVAITSSDDCQHIHKNPKSVLTVEKSFNRSKYFIDKTIPGDPTEDDEQYDGYLIDGYSLDGDLIICDASGKKVSDAPASVLKLNGRSYNALNRAFMPIKGQKNLYKNPNHKEIYISDILRLSLNQLVQIREMGIKTTKEIVEKTRLYLQERTCSENSLFTEITVAPGYAIQDDVITELKTGLLVADIGVDNLKLGVRISNKLKKVGIHYLSDLIKLTPQELLNLSSIGPKIVSEILEIVPDYLESNRVDSLQIVDKEHEEVSSSENDFFIEESMTVAPGYAEKGIAEEKSYFLPEKDAAIASASSDDCQHIHENQKNVSMVEKDFDESKHLIDITIPDNHTEDDKQYGDNLIDGFSVDGGLIICDASGKTVNDAPVAVLKLSIRAYALLSKDRNSCTNPNHKGIFISDVLQLSRDQLIDICYMGVKTAEEIIEKTRSYLLECTKSEDSNFMEKGITVAPGYAEKGIAEEKSYFLPEKDAAIASASSDDCQHIHENQKNVSMVEKDFDESKHLIDITIPDNHTEDDKQYGEYLIDGFSVDGGLIICDASGKTVNDAPVAVLKLSNRAYALLSKDRNSYNNPNHKGIFISDVLQLSRDQLIDTCYMGVKSAEEIIEKTRLYLLEYTNSGDTNFMEENFTITPRYTVIGGVITELKTGLLVADIGVDYLGFSVRALNSLRRSGIHYLSELIKLTPQQLSNFSNIGATTESEIMKFVTDYLESNKVDSLNKVDKEHGEVSNSENGLFIEERITVVSGNLVEDDEQYLIDGFSVDGGLIICDASGKTVNDAPVAVLKLSNRAYNLLYREKILNANPNRKGVFISDVLQLSWDQLIDICYMGVKTAEEIIEKTRSYLLECTKSEDSNFMEKGITIAPGYAVIDDVITELKTGLLVADIDVDYLKISARVSNSLRRSGIHYLSELIKLTPKLLSNFSNIGTTTVSEIMEFVLDYLESNKVDSFLSIPTFPELNPEIPVLAPDYAVVDGIIYNRKNFKIVQDVDLELLNLSVRSLSCLMRNGNSTIRSLVGMPHDDFRWIRSLGPVSANEIQEKLEQYLERNESVQQAVPDITVTASQVLLCFHENEFEEKSLEDICEMLPDAEENDLQEVLAKLVEEGKILKNDEGFSLYHHSFYEYIKTHDNSLKLDERAIRVLQMRANGSTLGEIGQVEGVSRERIRQIEKKTIDKVTKQGRILLEEDRYAYIFCAYSLGREFYVDFLGEAKSIWYYLNYRYSRGETDPLEAIKDKSISPDVRRSIDKYVHRGYVMIEGRYVLKKRGAIEDYIVEKYCKNDVTIDEFFELYSRFLDEYEINDEELKFTDVIKRTRMNRIFESTKLLWKQNKKFRYYDIEGTDFTELFETLNLGQYQNIELSTRKFIIEYPDLMERYDLRDEYEIHNLLRKLHAEKENPDLEFSRMPQIKFGTFDRDEAVKKILFAMAPVSQDDLAERISLEYGMQEATIKVNWLNCISEYYHQGIYSVDYEDMPEKHIAVLKEAFTGDFYFLSELRKIYSRLVPDADYSLLSTYNLKKMGFLVGSSYVIQHYPTAEAYFEKLLTSNDVVDITPISKRYTGLSTYSACLAKLKREMEIIEFEPFQYINIRRLEKLGFDRELLKQYGDRVSSFLVDDNFFTIQSLRKAGFKDELEMLGFSDIFYSSILKEDGRFSWQRVGNIIVFNPRGNQFTVHEFLVDIITNEQAIDVDDFTNDLLENYGISLDKHVIIERVKGSDVYYNSIMEKLYANYSTYFEEI